MKKLSIIVPVYGVEDYIARCYNSIANAIVGFEKEVEVIFVDDCGPDRSLEILESINKQNFTILKHDVNQGGSAARNTGIEQATGEYLMFVDSDDVITEDAINLILKKLKSNIDILKLAYIIKGEKSSSIFTYTKSPYLIEPLFTWSRIIKADIMIPWDTEMLYEDVVNTAELSVNSEKRKLKIDYINEPVYVYDKTREESITSSVNLNKSLDCVKKLKKLSEKASSKDTKTDIFTIATIITSTHTIRSNNVLNVPQYLPILLKMGLYSPIKTYRMKKRFNQLSKSYKKTVLNSGEQEQLKSYLDRMCENEQ